MRVVRIVWRATRLFAVVIVGIAVITADEVIRLLRLPPSSKVPDVVRWWHRAVCRALDLRVEIEGELAPKVMVVANHVSWLDIPVLGSLGRVVFLSKAEIRAWPVLGWLAAGGGTLFIRRGANQVGEIAVEIERRLRSGRSVAVFPEGTTSNGTYVRRFFPRLFAIAQHPGIVVQPVALRYGNNDRPDPIAPWFDGASFTPHALKVLAHPGLVVRVHIFPSLDSTGMDRRHLADRCRILIANSLEVDPNTAPRRHGRV